MKQLPPVNKNQDLELTIDALTSEASGVGRVEGYALFVPGALPGERVKAHVIKTTPSYGVAKLMEVLAPSPERVEPLCPAFSRCGGCALMHLGYPAQLAVKRQSVADALTRLGGFEQPNVLPILGMEEPYRYRNKGSFPLGMSQGVCFGFYAPRSHRLVPLSDCPIQEEAVMDAVRRVCLWAEENSIPCYDPETRKGVLRHVMARATATGEVMAVVVTATERVRRLEELSSAMEGVDSLWLSINDRDTNVILGDRFLHLGGKETVTEQIGALRFRVSPQSFLQVNAKQTAALYGEAVRLLAPGPEETILDAYCGIGAITLLLAGSAGRVVGVESVPEAVDDAVDNASANGIANAEFVCGPVEEVLPRLIRQGTRFDAMLMDPPRKGCEEKALQAVCGSGITRLVYVSCNPATLARDAKYLRENGGFRLVSATPVDMFPHTSHVETAALMERQP